MESLNTLEGVQQWGEFNDARFFKYFLIPNYRYPPLLVAAKALDLNIWIQPFIKKIEASRHLTNPRALLREFAWWVYCSSNYWANANAPGLHRKFDRYSKGYKQAFYPSSEAKKEWLRLLDHLGYS